MPRYGIRKFTELTQKYAGFSKTGVKNIKKKQLSWDNEKINHRNGADSEFLE